MNPQRGNRCVRTALALISVLAGGASVSTQAHAQAWLPDRAYTEGPGIRVGDLEIHPGIAVRGGYDNNVFKADGKTRSTVIDGRTIDVTQKEQGAGILAVTPHIHLSTLSEQRKAQGEDRQEGVRALPAVAFRGGVAATYFHYFIDNGPKNLEVDTDLALNILPGRPFNIDVNLAYIRTVRPFTQNAGNKDAFRFNSVAPRVRFNFGSKSGVLTGYAGYAPRLALYESDVFSYLNSFTHAAEAGAAWKFLPSTALVYDGAIEFQDYSEENPFLSNSPVLFSDNKRFRTRLGINGAITRTLALRVLAGYSAIAFDDEQDGERLDDHEDVIGEAILTYGFGPAQTSRFEIGYQRDLVSSALGGWNLLDRGFATVRALVGGVVQLSLEAGVAKVKYGRIWGYDRLNNNEMPTAIGDGGELDRDDIRVDGAVRGEYRVTNWLSFLADVSVQSIITDYQYAVFYQGGGSPVPDPAQYLAVMAFGGVRAHY
jgi:hypothetical protein